MVIGYLNLQLSVKLIPSVLGHIFTSSFECDQTVLLTLGKVYGGQKVKCQSVLCLSPHEFLKLYKQIISRINMKMHPISGEVKLQFGKEEQQCSNHSIQCKSVWLVTQYRHSVSSVDGGSGVQRFVCLLVPTGLGCIFVFILLVICRFYTASETPVVMKIVHTDSSH